MSTQPSTSRVEGDAIERLVIAHLDYARALAHKIAHQLPRGVDVEELVGFAQLGLTQAAQSYDPELGVAFTTFSYYRIRGAVFDGIRKMTWLPPESRKTVEQQDRVDDLCEHGLGAIDLDATSEELAEEFRRSVRTLGAVFLVSDAADEDGLDTEPVDRSSAADRAEQEDLIARVREVVSSLELRQAEIIEMVYFKHMSMTEAAEALGVNKATVSRAHAKAMDVLRDALAG